MRDELMTVAICWDIDNKVPAEFAHRQRNFAYYCPHEICMREVYAAQRKNTYFVAEDRHVKGCPNDTPLTEPPPTPGTPAKKVSIVPPPPIPTILGPNGVPVRKTKKPTIEELRTLARRLQNQKPYFPGKLVEVILAWVRLPKNERSLTPLRISGADLTYRSAFHFLGEPGDRIQDVPWDNKIVFGAAKVAVPKSNNCFFVTTVRTFVHQGARLNIVFRIPMDHYSADHLSGLVNRTCTAFYFGPIPSVSSTGKSFSIADNWDDIYKGVIVFEGEYTP